MANVFGLIVSGRLVSVYKRNNRANLFLTLITSRKSLPQYRAECHLVKANKQQANYMFRCRRISRRCQKPSFWRRSWKRTPSTTWWFSLRAQRRYLSAWPAWCTGRGQILPRPPTGSSSGISLIPNPLLYLRSPIWKSYMNCQVDQ